jgi:hypothetical protein
MGRMQRHRLDDYYSNSDLFNKKCDKVWDKNMEFNFFPNLPKSSSAFTYII